jgi:predicted dehydrogenase
MTETTHRPLRYAVVGTGSRAEMYVRALLTTHADAGSLVAFVDTNPVRMNYYDGVVASVAAEHEAVPHFRADEFDTMVADVRPDGIIVTTPDVIHSDYVVRGLELGLRVVVEKPLTVDEQRARAIAAAAEASAGSVAMTFNYRYSPRNTVVKELISAGEIGTPTSVHFEWLLDTGHGADYFRRWHRERANSGGLLVHKSTHHFDLVNWWLADVPATVGALGGLRFYGAENAAARGEDRPGRTSRDDPSSPFSIDLAADPRMKSLFLDAEGEDGYVRDQNVFGDGITIEDTMNVLVGYRGGAALSYSLHAYAPWEGYRVAINGTRGRVELDVVERPHRAKDSAEALDPSAVAEEAQTDADREALRPRSSRILLQRQWERPREIAIPEGKGGHGGGDAKLLDDVFRGDREDVLGHRAGHLDGLRSISIGIAANRAISSGELVRIEDLGLRL